MFVDQNKFFNRTLAIDSPFQTLTVGLLVQIIDSIALPLCAPEILSSSSKSKSFLYYAHLALFFQNDDTIITVAQIPR